MAKVESISELLKEFGGRIGKALAQGMQKEIEHDTSGQLPAGIEGGVAHLVNIRISKIAEGKTNVGKWQFYADGEVVEPSEHKDAHGNVIKLVGKRTRILTTIMDTPNSQSKRKTADDHFQWIQNQVALLAGSKSGLGTLDGLLKVMEALRKRRPYFKFSTRVYGKKQVLEIVDGKWCLTEEGRKVGKPYINEAAAKAANPYAGRDPMVNHVWDGCVGWEPASDVSLNGVEEDGPLADDQVPLEDGDEEIAAEDADDVNDAEQQEIEQVVLPIKPGVKPVVSNGKPQKPATVKKIKEMPVQASDEDMSDDNADGAASDDVDSLDQLAAAAQEDEEYAKTELTNMAKKVGISVKQVDQAGDWHQVVDMIRDKTSGGSEEEPAEEEEEAEETQEEEDGSPKIGQVWGFKPLDSKTKKRVKEAVEVEVTAIVDGKATIKLLEDGKVIKGVPLEKLEKLD